MRRPASEVAIGAEASHPALKNASCF